jgi:DNA-binding SARP family transcriptional activator
MAYQLRLLGRFELVSPTGGQITISSKKNQVLIAALALANGEPVLRSRLCDLLWQDRGEAQARSSLRQAFTALRKGFSAHGGFPLIVSEEDAAIDTKLISVDTSLLDKRQVEDVPGEFLEGLSVPGQAVQDWLLAQRQHFSTLVVDRLSNRMAELAGKDDHADLIPVAQSLLALDPLNEAAHRAVMRGFAGTGDRNKALKQYQVCCDLLMADLGIEPDAETRKIFEDIRNGANATSVQPAIPVASPKAAMATSDKPAITVESFEDLSHGREQPQFANALTREIVTELGHFPTMVVRTAAQAGAARHYVLQGSVQMLAGRVRVNVQLNEASSGNQVWGNRYDVELRDSLDLQDELARQIAGNLYQPLMTHATRRARQEPAEGSDEHRLYLQAYHHIERPTAEGMREAKSLLEKVLEIDPGYALAYESLAWVNFHSSFNGWTKDPWQGLQAARRDAARGLSLDDRNSYLRSSLETPNLTLGLALALASQATGKGLTPHLTRQIG